MAHMDGDFLANFLKKDCKEEQSVSKIMKTSSEGSKMTNVSSGQYAFQVGDCFNSYDDLLERLEKHSSESFVHYWRRDTRTVQGAIMKTTRPISKCLKYYSVRYACIHGGQKYAGRGEGRRQTNTLRSNCPSFIMLRASKCGQQLKVIGVCNEHNHEISEVTTRTLPQSRKLADDTKAEVLEMLNLHIDRKKILEYVKLTTKKHLTIKDLFNMKARHRNKPEEDPKLTNRRKDDFLRRIEDVCGTKNEEQPVAISLCEPETYFEIIADNTIVPVSPYSRFLNRSNDDEENGNYDNIIQTPSHEELDTIDGVSNHSVNVECVTSGGAYTVVDSYETIASYDNVQSPEIIEIEEKPIEPLTIEQHRLPPQRRTFRQRRTNHQSHRHQRSAGKSFGCGHCCLNARLIQKRIDVLRAKEQKLIEETHILRLTRERLISEAAGQV